MVIFSLRYFSLIAVNDVFPIAVPSCFLPEDVILTFESVKGLSAFSFQSSFLTKILLSLDSIQILRQFY